MLKGNKGEWSEIYTLIKLLGDKTLQIGDKDLNKIPSLLYPIIKILRIESNENYEYHIDDSIKIIKDDNELYSISVEEFQTQSLALLEKIKSTNKSAFELPEFDDFLSKLKCTTLKAKSSKKTDIRIVIHDLKTNMYPELGFSIKSQLGSPSTLFNAGKTTNFIYKINSQLTETQIDEINSIDNKSQIISRIEMLSEVGCELKFIKTENNTFCNNLILIDSLLHEILAEMLKRFYLTDFSKTFDLINDIERDNPLKFDINQDHKYYQYKIKKFLTEIAVGMMPSKVWHGTHDATGGYLVVKTDGDILAYNLYNRNEFEDYLFYNTRLETASTSRYGFGKIYKENNECFFKLNLQIRFIK